MRARLSPGPARAVERLPRRRARLPAHAAPPHRDRRVLRRTAAQGERMSVLIAPSLLSCDLSRIGEEIRAVEAAGGGLIHGGVRDRSFLPNITWGPPAVSAMKRVAARPPDRHL